MKITFTIIGNQDDRDGNPVPYVRMTQNDYFKPTARRYTKWKDHVKATFHRELNYMGFPIMLDDLCGGVILRKPEIPKKITLAQYQKEVKHLRRARMQKPINLKKTKSRMDIMIHWAGGVHGDPDNVWKGIADALFQNDKNVAGSFDFKNAEDFKGKVEVTIETL